MSRACIVARSNGARLHPRAWSTPVNVSVRERCTPYVENVDVNTNPVPGTPDLVDVDFDIEEGLPGQFGGGVGYSDSQKLLLNGNFVHTNFLGTGNRVALNIDTGRFRTIYSFYWKINSTEINLDKASIKEPTKKIKTADESFCPWI